MTPKISICIPYHQTSNTAFFLARLLKSISEQTFTDYEIILTAEGQFAENHNAAIKKAKGEIIKLMQMDDYFTDEHSLALIVSEFQSAKWGIVPSMHTNGSGHIPFWTTDIYTGNNRLGSISTIVFRKDCQLLFEEPLCWLVDCDWYYRMYLLHGEPKILNHFGVTVDVRTDRLSHTIPNEVKQAETNYLMQKYGK